MTLFAQIAGWTLFGLFMAAGVLVVVCATAKAAALRDFGGTDGDRDH